MTDTIINTENTENTEIAGKKHSVLSPSSSKVWLNCTPSAAMAEMLPEKESAYSTEGTIAHALAEYKVRKALFNDENTIADPYIEYGNAITEEMEKCTDMYLDYVLKKVNSFEDDGFMAEVFTEIPLDLTFCIPDGKGTADLVIIADNVISVIDFKYGAFTKVPGEENTQMMIYALGADKYFTEQDGYGPFETVSMSIFQPRMDNVTSFEMSMAELKNWEKEVLIPKAELAIKGAGELVKGDHCEICKAKYFCKFYRNDTYKNLEKIKTMRTELEDSIGSSNRKLRSASAVANMMSPEDLAAVITLSKGIDTWVEAVRARALELALDGEKIPGYKLIEKRGNDIVTEEAAKMFESFGYDPFKPATFKSKTAMKEEMKKNQNEKLFVTEILPLIMPGPLSPALVSNESNGEEKSAEYFKLKAEAEAENNTDTVIIDERDKTAV